MRKLTKIISLPLALLTLVLLLSCSSEVEVATPPSTTPATNKASQPAPPAKTKTPVAKEATPKRKVLKELPAKDLAYGDHKRQVLDIYGPEKRGSLPVMLYVHGGAWKLGSKSRVGEKVKNFKAEGWIFISISYRLSPAVKHPEHVRDVAKAIAWTLDNIADYGGDPDSLFLMGHSAGAHLVSLVATDERRLGEWDKKLSDIKGVISNDVAVYQLDETMKLRGYRTTLGDVFGLEEAGWLDAAPQEFVAKGKGVPPFVISHSKGLGFGAAKHWKDASESFAKSLQDAGVEATLFDGRDRSHRAINQRIGEPDDDFTALIWKALKRWQAR